MAFEGLEEMGDLQSPGGDYVKRSREGADIGVGIGVHMSILEASSVVMSDRRAAS